MKVLIINPDCKPKLSAGSYEELMTHMPPIGLAYLLGALEQAEIDCIFYDDLINKGNDKKLTSMLINERPDIIGIPIYTSPAVYRFEKISMTIRKILPKSLILSGNLHANFFAKQLLDNKLLDLVIKGEGEKSLVEVAKTLAKGGSLEQVTGLILRNDQGQIIETANRPPIADLDDLPFPAWHKMPYKKYNINELGKIAATGTFILGSRGCPFNCDFCSLFIQGTTRRVRSTKSLLKEVNWLRDNFRFKSFHFIDALWPASKKECEVFCQEMIASGLNKKIVWGTETRIDIMDRDLLKLMHEAGCRKVMYGIESGKQDVLDSVNKRNSLEQVKKVVEWSHQEGLNPTGFFMLGLPGETAQDIEATINFSRELKLHFAKFSCFVPYPGTRSYSQLKENGLITYENQWNHYTSYPTAKNPPPFLPAGLSAKQLSSLQRKAHLRFFLRPKQLIYLIGACKFSVSSFLNSARVFVSLVLKNLKYALDK